MKKFIYPALLIIIIVAGWRLAGFGQGAPTNVVVSQAEPVVSIKGTQDIPLPNCAGSAELLVSVASNVTIEEAVEVTSKAVDSNGASIDIPEVAKVELKNEVENSYKSALANVIQLANTMTMKAAPHTNPVYVIEWRNRAYSSTMNFKYNGKSYQTAYTYTLPLPQISGSYDIPCASISPTTSIPASTLPPAVPPTTPPAIPPVISSTSTPNVQDPEGFLHYYFSLLTSSKNYPLAWSLLTPKFQKVNDPGGYEGFVDYWKTVSQVDLNNIQIDTLSKTSVNCRIDAAFHTTRGITPNVLLKYHLIYDRGKGSWMFDNP
jgi:hypothetical protein